MTLLGSTGSIGTQAVDVVTRNPDAFRVVALSAGGADPRALAAQAATLGVETVAVAHADAADAVRTALAEAGAPGVEVLAGARAAGQQTKGGKPRADVTKGKD